MSFAIVFAALLIFIGLCAVAAAIKAHTAAVTGTSTLAERRAARAGGATH